MRSVWTVLVLAGLVATGGCQKLNFSDTKQLQPKETRAMLFSAPAYQQKVTVTITPTTTGVSAYLCKEDDLARVELQLGAGKQPSPELIFNGRASEAGPTEYSFDATVPAKTPYALVLKGGNQATEVKVKVVGR